MTKSLESKIKVLVLDGDHKNALAIVRHLGKSRKYNIDLICYSKASVAYFSKYANNKYIIRGPKKYPEKFIQSLLDILSKNEYKTVIPVSYISFQLCSKFRDEISLLTNINIASNDQIKLASNKIATYDICKKLGIPFPKVYQIKVIDEINSIEIKFPCVIKGPFEMGKNLVDYASNKKDLVAKYHKMCNLYNFKDVLPIVQNYIVGEGAGFFAYYKNGKCINYFIHKRIREYPVTGGASTVAESYFNEDILKYGERILDYLKWEGVAMVEFKKDNLTNEFNLMEVNAKFWGSLDLSLSAGVNFPQMLIDGALENQVTTSEYYKLLRYQWILNGDLFHLIQKPSHILAFIKDLFIAKNDILFTDIFPNIYQFFYIPVHYYKKWFK